MSERTQNTENTQLKIEVCVAISSNDMRSCIRKLSESPSIHDAWRNCYASVIDVEGELGSQPAVMIVGHVGDLIQILDHIDSLRIASEHGVILADQIREA